MDEEEFYEDLFRRIQRTAKGTGMKLISDEHCCKLLAWLYAYGGGTEAVTLNFVLNEDIKYAQKRLNIIGGDIPNTELLPLLQKYMREIDAFKSGAAKKQPAWVKEICKYYRLKGDS